MSIICYDFCENSAIKFYKLVRLRALNGHETGRVM